ncbi:MAG: efflux RND transporter periplasmic adaptor subunit [Pseudomonadota bacterium]
MRRTLTNCCLLAMMLGLADFAVIGMAAAEARITAPVRGILKAQASATISSEVVGQIAELPFREGQSFKAGDLLLRFDCRHYQADLKAADAERRVAAITVKESTHLRRLRAAGANELAIAEAKLDQAEATVEALKIKLDQCGINAPFDGRIAKIDVEVFERPPANRELLTIVRTGALEIDLIVPSDWIAWLSKGQTFSFSVDETEATYDAVVLETAAVVDPVSRTVKVSARLQDQGPFARPGMSGSARFTRPNG